MSHFARRRPQRGNRRRPFPIYAAPVVAIAFVALSAALFAGPRVQDTSLADAIAEQRNRAYGAGATAESLNDLGNLLVLDEQNQAAIEAYRRALEMDPAHLPAGFNLGLLLDSAGESQESLTIFQNLLDFHPEHARTHYQVGSLLERAGRERAAIGAYVRAFELDPFLALPDVNPQITDNELVTEALLRVEVEADAQQDAPRIYSEPTKVASLLMPSTQEPVEPATTETPEEGAVASDDAATLRSLGVDQGERQLNTGDLSSTDLRRVDTPAASPSPEDEALLQGRRNDLRERVADDAATTRSSAAPETETDADEPPARTLSVRDLSTGRVNQAAPTAGAGSSRRSSARGSSRTNNRRPSTNRGSNTSRPRSSSPTRFRPGRRSSAQLDLRLVPRPAAAANATAPAPARD